MGTSKPFIYNSVVDEYLDRMNRVGAFRLPTNDWKRLHELRTSEIRCGDRVRFTQQKIDSIKWAMEGGAYAEQHLVPYFYATGTLLEIVLSPEERGIKMARVIYSTGFEVFEPLAYFTRETLD